MSNVDLPGPFKLVYSFSLGRELSDEELTKLTSTTDLLKTIKRLGLKPKWHRKLKKNKSGRQL